MPIHEYRCPQGHVTEKIFPTFGQAEREKHKPIWCPVCRLGGASKARLVEFSVPLPAHFYGDPAGYAKPSPTKRFSYKLAAQKGNEGSAG